MSFLKVLKNVFIGRSRDPQDHKVFHNISLIAFFAWVGLGADGLSSSCYGPEEAFIALGEHRYLGIFVALMTAATVLLISASYSQIIELFPTGGGGYLVASKLLNPTLGMVSGCALLIDYVLTIAISVASGSDALFSFLPAEWQVYKLGFALAGVFILMVMNLRGVKESVLALTPIFLIFVVTHIFAILYAVATHIGKFPEIVRSSATDISSTQAEVGIWGLLFLIMRAYSLGAGTYTGIEAVSNGLPILREPKVATGKRTMKYMSVSLAFTVAGLMIAYLLFDVVRQPHKTLNASLFENMTLNWPIPLAAGFILVTLFSEAMLLFVAAQTGFVGGPQSLSNMALDRWMPSRFSSLSDRLVTQNGVLLMGGAAFLTVLACKGSVHFLVVLYSINVFITFCLSQAGMVRHWWEVRRQDRKWKKKIIVNGLGLSLTTFILLSVVILKFFDGGWLTLLITGMLAGLAFIIKRHYRNTYKMVKRLDTLLDTVLMTVPSDTPAPEKPDPRGKTAVILVSGFNGLGLHTLMAVIKNFGKDFKNYVFLQAGILDAGNFKGAKEVSRLKATVEKDLGRYVEFMNNNGCYAEGHSALGTDVVEEIERLSQETAQKFPGAIFFAGQMVFPQDTWLSRMLHNYTVFAIQQKFYRHGYPLMVLPIRM